MAPPPGPGTDISCGNHSLGVDAVGAEAEAEAEGGWFHSSCPSFHATSCSEGAVAPFRMHLKRE